MADNKEYLVQTLENGTVMISEEVVASIASIAVREVDGVYGLSVSASFDISNILGKKNLRRGIRVEIKDEGVIIGCNLVVKLGVAVMDVAKAVQEGIADQVYSMTGVRPAKVNVNVCGIAVPKVADKE